MWDSAGQAGEVLRMKEPDGEDLASHTGPKSCEGRSDLDPFYGICYCSAQPCWTLWTPNAIRRRG